MKKLSVYYSGEDRSHCGSCWSKSDEEVDILFLDLDSDKVKELFIDFSYSELYMEENYCSRRFLKWIHEKSWNEEDDIENYFSLFFTIDGTSYCPNMLGNRSVLEEWDINALIKPSDILGKDSWDDIQKKFKDNIRYRLDCEIKNKQEREKKEKEKLDYEQKLFEYNNYIKLKDTWEGKEKPKKPKSPPKSEFEKILDKIRKENKNV
jgi:hypothetical protein